ncbi:MAG: transglycosylase SLT domain-containing protein [Gammaproteobacteria bacterium]|nr:transglycosylase SLT domain-containing protein [Gammaproteobacteria bacterium]
MNLRVQLLTILTTALFVLSLPLSASQDYSHMPIKKLRRLAERGDIVAQVELATALEHGEGIGKNMGLAITWYCRAARHGSADAQRSLGWIYANGSGVPKDDELAAYWLARAAGSGDDYAARLLSFITDDAPKTRSGGCRHVAGNSWLKLQCSSSSCREIQKLVESLAVEYGLDTKLVLAVIAAESNFNPRAKSPKGAAGLMQLIPATARRFGVEDVWDKEQNIRGGMTYLRWLLAYFEGDVARVLAGYNAGERAVASYGGIPPYPETQAYVQRILKAYGKTGHIYDKRWLNYPADPAIVQQTDERSSESDGA